MQPEHTTTTLCVVNACDWLIQMHSFKKYGYNSVQTPFFRFGISCWITQFQSQNVNRFGGVQDCTGVPSICTLVCDNLPTNTVKTTVFLVSYVQTMKFWFVVLLFGQNPISSRLAMRISMEFIFSLQNRFGRWNSNVASCSTQI